MSIKTVCRNEFSSPAHPNQQTQLHTHTRATAEVLVLIQALVLLAYFFVIPNYDLNVQIIFKTLAIYLLMTDCQSLTSLNWTDLRAAADILLIIWSMTDLWDSHVFTMVDCESQFSLLPSVRNVYILVTR